MAETYWLCNGVTKLWLGFVFLYYESMIIYLGSCFNERRIQYDRFFSFICNNLRWHIIIGGVKVSIWTKSLLNLFLYIYIYIYILGIILLAWIIDIRWSDTLVLKKLTLVGQHCYTWLRFIINEINKWFFFFFNWSICKL